MRRLATALISLLLVAGCGEPAPEKAQQPLPPAQVMLGNAGQGQKLIAQYGCNVCHTIPGIDGPQGSIGPSLAGVASRPTLSAAAFPNTPENLVGFIQNPASKNPQSAMPAIGMAPGDANHIAAYLETLK